MEPSWQEPSLWSRLHCDVVLLPECSMSPPGKEELLGGWGSIKPQVPESQNDTRTNNIEISYIKKKNDRSTDEAGDEKQKD